LRYAGALIARALRETRKPTNGANLVADEPGIRSGMAPMFGPMWTRSLANLKRAFSETKFLGWKEARDWANDKITRMDQPRSRTWSRQRQTNGSPRASTSSRWTPPHPPVPPVDGELTYCPNAGGACTRPRPGSISSRTACSGRASMVTIDVGRTAAPPMAEVEAGSEESEADRRERGVARPIGGE